MLCFFCSIQALLSLDFLNLKFSGETNYHESQSKSLISSVNMNYRFNFYEPSHKKYIVYIGGVIVHDYDHFGKTIKINGITTLGIDF
jgi:hypothetical protein